MTIKEEIDFSAEFGSALKDLKAFTKDANSQIQKVGDAFSFLGTVAKGAIAVFAGREIINGINAVVDAAAHQEETLTALNTQLALAGDYSQEASKQMQAFASQMQKTTKYDDDLVISQLALAKTFGLSNDGAQKLVKTAADLAAATGVSLDTAVEQLGKTLQGTTGTLGKTIPGIKSLTKESLAAGGAIDLIANRFGGAANASINTFSGSIAQLSNTFGDMLEEIGAAIVKNPVVIGAFQALSKIMENLTATIINNQDALKDFVATMIKLAFDAVPYLLKGIEYLVKIFGNFIELIIRVDVVMIGWFKDLLQFKIVQSIVEEIYKAFTELLYIIVQAAKGFSLLAEYVPGFSDKAKDLTKQLQGVADGLVDANKAGVNFKKVGAVVDDVKDAYSKAANTARNFTDSTVKGLDKGIAYSDQLAKNINKISTDASGASKIFENLNAGAQGSSFGDVAKKIGAAFQVGADYVGKVLSVAFSVIGGLFSGDYINKFAGFVKQIGEFPKAILEAMKNLDGIISGLLEQLPQFIKDFLAEIPKLVQSFVKNFPKLINILLSALPKIVDTISNAIGPIVKTIITAIPKIINALPELIDRTLQELPKVIDIILKGLPKIILAITKAIPKIIKSLAAAIPEIVQVFADNLPAIIEALVVGILSAIPEIVIALIDVFIVKGGIFKIVGAIIASIPQIIIALVNGLAQAVKNSFGSIVTFVTSIFSNAFSGAFKGGGEWLDVLTGKKLVEGIKNFFNGDKIRDILTGKILTNALTKIFQKVPFLDKLKELFTNPPFLKKLKELLKNIGGGGGGGGFLGLAEGGQVQTVPPGYPNDSFPARLTSGELVVDRGTNKKLEDFLDNGGGGGSFDLSALANLINSRPMIINVQVGEQQLATAMLNVNRRGYRTI